MQAQQLLVQVQQLLVQVQQPLAQSSNLRPTAGGEGPVPVLIDAPWLVHVRTRPRRHGWVDGSRHEQWRGLVERRRPQGVQKPIPATHAHPRAWAARQWPWQGRPQRHSGPQVRAQDPVPSWRRLPERAGWQSMSRRSARCSRPLSVRTQAPAAVAPSPAPAAPSPATQSRCRLPVRDGPATPTRSRRAKARRQRPPLPGSRPTARCSCGPGHA